MNDILPKIHDLAVQINADGFLNFQSADGANLLRIARLFDAAWVAHPTYDADHSAEREYFIAQGLKWVDNLYAFKHPQISEAKKDQLYTGYAYLYVRFPFLVDQTIGPA